MQAPAESAAAQEASPAEPSSFLEEVLALSESEGPAAAIARLEARRSDAGLGPEEEALLGILLFTAGRADESFRILEPLARADNVSPAVLFNAWRAAAASGRGFEQIELLERAAALAPVSPAARQLGFLYGNQGRLEDAFLLLVPWARAQPDDTEARLAAAHAALQLSRVPVAEEMLSDLPQDIPQVRLLWGKALFLRGEPYGALATLEALGSEEGLPSAMDLDRRLTMANAYIGIGEATKAIELLEGRAGDDPRLIVVLGKAQSQTGQMDNALATLQPLAQAVMSDQVELSDDMAAGALLDYGRALIATGSHIDAVAPLERASALDQDNPMVWQSLGQALAVAGRRDEASAALERFNSLAQNAVPTTVQSTTLEKDVDDPTARQLRAALKLAGQGRVAEALDEARRERRLSPGDPRVLLVESQILSMLDQQEEALAVATEAVEMAPDFADVYYQRGVVLMGQRRFEEAESDFRRSLELSPTHTPTMNDFAVLLMYLERNDEARELLQRALEINPEDTLARSNLDQLDS